ncbi:P-type conjugative transfer protein TrbJ [Sandaracinobacter neustonicus]|uniref:P-type conjugative transfer protein TrbJ n=1 Tax=Sandaracinobacter neustonicus TaxID=1715348 RepID=A0A501XGX5_9SPHN|nr:MULTISPECIES: P-type conjugative transfer protein TrbJ [Alphaproteobacteria]TPE59800.1 P-type conjugative transfer protein TrbJ [Sandaracinobacter neustonicus]
MNRRFMLAVLAATVGGFALPATPAAAQWTVFDPTNYTQNVLTAARTLQQINNQISSLQNQATMLQNMARQLQRLDFSTLNEITRSMQRIDALMTQAQGIAFDIASTDEALRDRFPEVFDTAMTTDAMLQQAQAQLQAATRAFRQTMRVQAQVVENIQSDGPLLTELVTQSQGATGSLQAQQATNQLLAVSARQQLQLQAMMAAQYRAEAVEQERQRQAMAAARERTRRFIGSPNAYTPD